MGGDEAFAVSVGAHAVSRVELVAEMGAIGEAVAIGDFA